DDDFLFAHGGGDFVGVTLAIDHEAVGDRLHVGDVFLLEEVEDVLARIGDDLAAVLHEVLDLKAGAGRGHGGVRHHGRTPVADLVEEVRPADGGAGAQAGHAVDLGEGAEQDDVFIFGDEVRI